MFKSDFNTEFNPEGSNGVVARVIVDT